MHAVIRAKIEVNVSVQIPNTKTKATFSFWEKATASTSNKKNSQKAFGESN